MDRLIADGPLEFWSDEKPPSPGQQAAIAHVACALLGIPEPTTRLNATIALCRMRLALDELKAGEREANTTPDPIGF